MSLARRAGLLVPVLVVSACSGVVSVQQSAGSASGVGSSTGAGAGGGAPPAVHAEPPPPSPSPAPPDPTKHLAFAIRTLNFGDTDPDGTPDTTNGWKHLGYDIDGKISTAASTDLCQPLDNAPPSYVYPDGDEGIDNAFGAHSMTIFRGVDPDFSAKVQAKIQAGLATLLIAVDGIGAGADYGPLPARLYAGAPLGHPAAFDGTDVWPVRPYSLSDPTDVDKAVLHTDTSYLVGDTWVGRFQGVLDLELPASVLGSVHVKINAPVVSMRLDPTHRTATGGVISGVWATSALHDAVVQMILFVDPEPEVFCTSAGDPQGIVAQFEQASDILADGTQDPAQSCTGVSVGLGFEAAPVVIGGVGAPDPPLPNPCVVDAGAPDGG